jgi:threonine dehydratase
MPGRQETPVPLPTLAELEAAEQVIRPVMAPTSTIAWPLLSQRAGAQVWVKHENHTPIGAFKIRGGLVYVQRLLRARPEVRGLIAATRGNHGQSIALAARQAGLRAVIVVPAGNSLSKNAAMRALGAELREEGADFQESLEYAMVCAEREGLHLVPSFASELVAGVGTVGLELLRAVPLDSVYVPIGMGSGVCGMIAARDALTLDTEVIGVVAAGAPAYANSYAARRPVPFPSANTLADGMACRTPDPVALEHMLSGVARMVTVEDYEIRAAMRHFFTDTHNLAEGAGAAGLAALLKERERMAGRRVGLVLTGGNVDCELYSSVLAAS